MPRFEPFVGLRYDPAVLARHDKGLDDVVAPPYDVISPEQRAVLAGRSPYNAVRVELPVAEEAGQDPYRAAAVLLEAWQEEGVLSPDEGAAFYAYSMSFTDSVGRPRQTVGVIGALGVSPVDQGDVLPHEHTMAKPKSDRLDLLRACRANLSPVWGLSLAPGLSDLCRPDGPATARATDDDGVVHELWPLTEPASVDAISDLVASAPVVLADGHHRYETALAYREERRAASGDRADGPASGLQSRPGSDLVMALVVELSEDQLAVGPIHRLVSGLSAGFDLPTALEARFHLESAGPAPARDDMPPVPVDAPLLLTRSGTWRLLARPETVAAAEEDLDSSRLALALAELGPCQLAYTHDRAEVVEAVMSGQADAAVLVRPAPVAVIAEAARGRRRMPPKTTFFTPKPRTGMVFRPVRD